MAFVDNDHVIEKLSANAPNQPFDVRTLPRRRGCREESVNTEALYAPAESISIDTTAVV